MHKRVWLSVAMLATGCTLLVATSLANAAASSPSVKKGGTLRVNIPGGDIDDIDPAIAYGTTSWEIQYATALKLLNYPDKPAPAGSRLVPEGATGYKVSKNGRVYTFTIRPGFRFSNGRPVTVQHYAYGINRALNKDLQSPAFQFIADPNGANIVGAQAVRDGRASTAAGVRVRGNKLIITMTKADPTFLAKISMPFFQATWTGLSRTTKVISVSGNSLPSAGPYYVSSREPNRSINVLKNPHYAKGVAKSFARRPANLAGLNFKAGVNLEAGYREVRANQADYQLGLPPSAYAELAREFGINRGRFRINPINCTSYMALNNDNPLFRGNIKLRQAVNFALSRRDILNQYGVGGGSATDQLLPPTFPGFKNANIYPLNRPNLTKARALARGQTRSGKGIIFHGLTAPGPQVMEIARADMRKIGIDLEPQGFRGFAIYDAAGTKGSNHAFTIGTGWCQDYPDPYDFINILLYGGAIQAENNNNLSYFNNRTYNKKMERAARLIGKARMQTYGNLDIDIFKNQAPLAPYRISNNRQFFSARVDMRSYVYQPIYEAPAYTVLALR